jgi:hypothetical protein
MPRPASASTRKENSPASTTNCCRRSPKNSACESISSGWTSLGCWLRWLRGVSSRVVVDHHHRRPTAHGGLHQRGPLVLVAERIWSLRVGAAGRRSDGDDRDPVLYSGIGCCVELQEVNPRPGRTTVALRLRAVSDGPDRSVTMGSMARRRYSALAQHQATSSGTGEQQFAYCTSALGGASMLTQMQSRTRRYRRLRCAAIVSTAARVR